MKALDFYDILRLITCALSLISLFYLSRRAYRYWPLFTTYLRDIWFTIVGFQILLLESNLESTLRSIDGGPRTVISLLVSLVCLRATRKKDTQFLTSWKKAADSTKT